MKHIGPILLGLSFALTCGILTKAQAPATTAPKYIQIVVEYPKPGKGGLAHDKTESAFVAAVTKAKFPIHYTAFNAMTGKNRALYISRFNSFAEIEAANKTISSPAAAAEFERLNLADGELLEDAKTIIFSSVPELSYHSITPGGDRHFLEIDIIKVKPGHGKEFSELVKLWQSMNDKAGTSNHWGAYHAEYGEDAAYYVFMTAHKSLADVDTEFADYDKIGPTLTDDDKKKMRELRAACIDEDHTELYAANPAQSYVTDEYIKADPTFWKPAKPAAAAAAAKPAAATKKP
jgi:hypothetical protein